MTVRSTSVILTAVVVVGAAVYTLMRSSPTTSTAGVASARDINPPSDAPAIRRTASDSEAERADSPTTANAGEARTTQTAGHPDRSDVEFDIIGGVPVKKDRNCTPVIVTYVTSRDGKVDPVWQCKPDAGESADAYTTYPTESLESLAYSDAEAAHVLSQRFREKDFAQATNYAVRAAALSGTSDSVRWLLNTYPTSTYRNNEVLLFTIEDNYVLSGVLHALDGLDSHLSKWSLLVTEHEPDGIDRDALDARITNLMSDYESIRREAGMD